jgi:hypothetical protein
MLRQHNFSSGEITGPPNRLQLVERVLQRSSRYHTPTSTAKALIGPHIPGGNNSLIIADLSRIGKERVLAGERRMWDDDSMPKRNLRIIKRVRNIPVRGTCEFCNAQFYYEPHPHSQQSESQAALQQQFNAHQCKVESDSADPATPKEENA